VDFQDAACSASWPEQFLKDRHIIPRNDFVGRPFAVTGARYFRQEPFGFHAPLRQSARPPVLEERPAAARPGPQSSSSSCRSARRRVRLVAEHNLAGQFELFAAHGVEHFSGRLSRTFAPSLRPLAPLDQIEAGTRIPDPAVALAGQRDELPAAGAGADFLDGANALAKLPRVLSAGVDFLVFTDTPSRSASASDWERAFLLRRGGEGGIRAASGRK
jgi:hypothetical protein